MAGFDDLIHFNFINAIQVAEELADRPPGIFNPFIDHFGEYSGRQFVKLYRLTKPVALEVINILEHHLPAPRRISELGIDIKICDPNLRIRNVVARYPGSSHESYVWNDSNVFHYIRNLHNNGYVLGDSGYALRPWMLTPMQNAVPGSPEERYNIAQKRTRS